MSKCAFGAALVLALSSVCLAQGTQLWTQTKAEDFEKGTSHGVAIRSDGTLQLAPAMRVVTTSPSTYIWDIVSDTQGNTYVAAGSPARLYRIAANGQSTTLWEGKELQAQAVLTAPDGSVFFATAPEGQIYRVLPGAAPAASPNAGAQAQASNAAVNVFFSPKTKYIWALALDRAGNLYAATGDNGEIYKIDPQGHGAVFFKTDDPHIRSMAFDAQGNLIAGSDGSGLIYRISPQGQGFVLFSAPKKEIVSLTLDRQGNIYTASIGDKKTAGTRPSSKEQAAPATGGSEVDVLAPDGSARKLWSSQDDLVYALQFDARGQLLIGTGNRGRVYSADPAGPSGQFTNLLKLSANQVTAFAPGRDGIMAATSNLGKIISISSQAPEQGTFESDVFDAKTIARWGRPEVHGRGRYELALRTGNVDNPDRNWSNWTRLDVTGAQQPDVPLARFAQWRITMTPGAEVDTIGINYRPKNIAPVVDEVSASAVTAATAGPSTAGTTPAARPHDILVRWNAHDDNNDELRYSVYYRGVNERRWVLLRDGLREKQLTLDSSLFPDGEYQVRIVASDAGSHAPEDALTGDRVSQSFDVDSTAPRIDGLQAVNENNVLHISFRALDSYSPVRRAEYSIDAGDWQMIEPVGGISDAKTETYDFDVLLRPVVQEEPENAARPSLRKRGRAQKQQPAPVAPNATAPQEHLVVVRAYDRFDNQATAKTVVGGEANAATQRQ